MCPGAVPLLVAGRNGYKSDAITLSKFALRPLQPSNWSGCVSVDSRQNILDPRHRSFIRPHRA